jgi:hypothetical protein
MTIHIDDPIVVILGLALVARWRPRDIIRLVRALLRPAA